MIFDMVIEENPAAKPVSIRFIRRYKLLATVRGWIKTGKWVRRFSHELGMYVPSDPELTTGADGVTRACITMTKVKGE